MELIESSRGGVGFRGMRERLRQLGGSLEIHSEGSGTVVSATLRSNQNQLNQSPADQNLPDPDQGAGHFNSELDVPSEQPL